jgi:hypothetical protein
MWDWITVRGSPPGLPLNGQYSQQALHFPLLQSARVDISKFIAKVKC